MKTVAIRDFLTKAESKKVIEIYDTAPLGQLHMQLVAFIEPLMPEIDRKLGQPNDIGFIAYAIEYALHESAHVKPKRSTPQAGG